MGFVNNHRGNHKQTDRRHKHRNDSTFLAPLNISNHFGFIAELALNARSTVGEICFSFLRASSLSHPEISLKSPEMSGYNAIYISLGSRLKLSSLKFYDA